MTPAANAVTWQVLADAVDLPADATHRAICTEILRTASAGELTEVLPSELAAQPGDPYLALLSAEAAFRRDPKQVFALVTAIQPHLESTPELSTWAAALLADVALSQTSPEVLMPIVTGTYPPATSPLGRLCELRINRARLVVLGLAQNMWSTTHEALDQLDADFCTLGAAEEGATTGCIRASLDVVHQQPGVELILNEVVATCRRLIDLHTDRSATALLLAVGACHLAEDPAMLSDVIEASGIVFATDSWQRAAVELFRFTAKYRQSHAAQDLNAAEHWFGLLLQRFAQPWLLVAEAHNFLDYERGEPARQTLALTHSSGMITAQTVAGLDALRARAGFGDHPDDAAVQRLDEVVEAYVSAGLPGQATVFALRASLDCQRQGRDSDGERFYALAVQLAADREWSNTEHRLFHLATANSRIAGPPSVAIITLDGSLRLLHHGMQVSLGRLAVRLVTLLAGSPEGASIDAILEALYPEVDREVARSRFNLLLHRLRERLDSQPGELIERTDSTVRLVKDHWYVDAWDFVKRAAHPSTEVRLGALEIYRDNFAGTDGLFDDAVIDIRRRLEVLWCDLVIGLLQDGALDSDDVARRADELGIHFPRLMRALSEHHQAQRPT